MEEYLNKRQKIREQEKKRFGGRFGEREKPCLELDGRALM